MRIGLEGTQGDPCRAHCLEDRPARVSVRSRSGRRAVRHHSRSGAPELQLGRSADSGPPGASEARTQMYWQQLEPRAKRVDEDSGGYGGPPITLGPSCCQYISARGGGRPGRLSARGSCEPAEISHDRCVWRELASAPAESTVSGAPRPRRGRGGPMGDHNPGSKRPPTVSASPPRSAWRSRRPAVAAPVPRHPSCRRPLRANRLQFHSRLLERCLSPGRRIRDNELSEASEWATQHRRSNTGEDASVAPWPVRRAS